MLPAEMGFLQCYKRSLLGTMHGRMGVVVRFIGTEIKDCFQVPGACVSSTTRWFSFILEEAQSCLHQPRRRARVQKFCAIGSVHAKV